jgi:DsbC/DsbD-like thiol-disulfide interchange protein
MRRLSYVFLLPLVATSSAPSHRAESGVVWPTSVDGATRAASLRPVHWVLVGGESPRQVVPGRTVAITVQADIAKGWHIYSLNQKPGGPIPLRIELIGGPDVTLRGLISAPKPERTFDKNFGIETELYSGSPRFTIPVGVAGKSPTGIQKFQIGARYQVCSDKVCLPPRTDKLEATIRISSKS